MLSLVCLLLGLFVGYVGGYVHCVKRKLVKVAPPIKNWHKDEIIAESFDNVVNDFVPQAGEKKGDFIQVNKVEMLLDDKKGETIRLGDILEDN